MLNKAKANAGNHSYDVLAGVLVVTAFIVMGIDLCHGFGAAPSSAPKNLTYKPKQHLDTSGFGAIPVNIEPWRPDASLLEIRDRWKNEGDRQLKALKRTLADEHLTRDDKVINLLKQAGLCNYDGKPQDAYEILLKARAYVESNDGLATDWLYTIVFFQGVCSLRQGENDNCVLCRGESSCILPIAPAAVHTKPQGSRQAIVHFTEYLNQFPDDLEVRWLLNLAHMTLGEHPDNVDPRFLVRLDSFTNSEFNIGKFRDVGHLAGVNRLNQAGGVIMEDFDNDGMLDFAVTAMDPTQNISFYRNKGDGTFEDRTEAAGLVGQLGGLNLVQTDYNNDGNTDIFIVRGAWLLTPIRHSLLRNNGNGTFTDVTKEAGLGEPGNSLCASWADFDNDGFLDLFVCGERQPNRLYRNRGDGTFEDVSEKAGVKGTGKCCKGCAWIDYDNDGYPDLFCNYLTGTGQLFHNNRDGTFTDVTKEMGIDGPVKGFSCWACDYDNDGWLDIFATCYDHSVQSVVQGMLDQPHKRNICRLYRNLKGKGFEDVTKAVGLDKPYATMGSNFGDFDNDGFLDFYLATGDPQLSMLVPNRMLKNVGGKRFADITGTSGTGHLQKGHGVACGDLRRDGHIDLFVQSGGAINGDKYHNVLFLNPGQGNNWLTVKLVGKKTNRPAIGARIKAVTDGDNPLTVHRHVSSGSSFGANPLQQTLGLGKANRVATLEIQWPTSQTTQVFHNVDVNQAIEITEFADDYRKLNWTPLPAPK